MIGYLLPTLEVHFISIMKEWQVAFSSNTLTLCVLYQIVKRVFTDVYMYDPSLRKEIHKSAEELKKKRLDLEDSGISFPTANYDLVLDIVKTEDEMSIYQYYYVDHNNRTLFWLDDYEMKPLLDGILGVKEPGHISR